MNYSSTQHGFTLVEMMLVISIVALVVVMSTDFFGGQAQEVVVDNSYASVISAIQSTRSKAMHGVGDTSHGVFIEQNKITLFEGDTYNNAGRTIELPPNVYLESEENEIIFERISGSASHLSDTILTITNNKNATRTITISPQGYVY